jgi:flotillin
VGPLTEAQAQMEVINAQAELARQRAELRERELVAEVVKPAEAEAEKVRILAKADAERMRIQAEAAASHNRVALDRMLIDQLPQIVKEAAGGLAGANVNVLNGADGLSELAAGLVGQGLTILDSLKKNLATSSEAAANSTPSSNGSAPEGSPEAGPPAIEGTPGTRPTS